MSKNSERLEQAMSTAVASEYMRKMVEREYRGSGDQENAVRRIGRRVGLAYWPAYRLTKGTVKGISIDVFDRVRGAYLDFCAAEIRELQNEISRERERFEDASLEDLDRQVAELAAEVRRRKERMSA